MKLDNNFASGKERFRFYLSQPDQKSHRIKREMKSETMDILQNKYGYPAAYHAELFTNNKGGV